MTELGELWLYALGLAAVVVFSILYSLGGREGVGKWVRREVGGGFLALSCLGLALAWGTFSWWSMGILVGLPAALHLGYGAGDKFERELKRRALYGFLLGLQAVWFGFKYPFPDLVIAQVILSVITSVYLGLRNPLKPSGEEMLIAALSVVVFPFLAGRP